MLTAPHFTPRFPAAQWTLPAVLEHQARVIPDRPFLRWGDDTPFLGFDAVNRQTNRLAHGLRALGVGHGDRMAMLLPNSLDFVFCWFALNKLGATEVPINTAYKGGFLEHQVNISGARMLAVDIDLLEVVRESLPHMPGIDHVLVWSRRGAMPEPLPELGACTVSAFAAAYGEDEANPVAAVRPQDIASIIFTSGTTGLSKGVLMPHAQCYLFAENGMQVTSLRPDDRYSTDFPLFHANAQVLSIYPCLIGGASCVMYERFSATQWVERLHASGATVINSIGVMLPFVYAQDPTPLDATHKLRTILAAPVPDGILDEFKKRFGVRHVTTGFGQTEICLPFISPLEYNDDRPAGAMGVMVDQFFETKLVDPETDEEVGVGEIGELLVRHKLPWTINAGYVGMPDKTTEAWRNLWFHTGDALKRDAQGWFYFVDRYKDALRRRGENISSFEVEAPIRKHPAVADVAVVAVPAESGGEDEIKACIVLKDGHEASHEDIIRWCEPRLPYFAVPRYLEFMAEFPRTPSEKIQKNLLRERASNPATWDRVRAGVLLADEAARRHRTGR
ncbi:MAG TPA: AMP-binding protein [Gammaproteobacteria bacterium]|nr:AMP-binding protein [Gammaproteobacteria bacterium]